MTPDALTLLAQANIGLSAGVVLALALRKPVRQAFGAQTAYGLWLLPLLLTIASLLPARPAELLPLPPLNLAPAPMVAAAQESLSSFMAQTPAAAQGLILDPGAIGLALWLGGLTAMILWLFHRQIQFMEDVACGEAGPAVVGFLQPSIITPADFETRFTPRERTVVLAHEKIHLARHDARINAVVAVLRCVCWFNPLVHIGAHLMRVDQELACDAAVVDRHPKARKPYAEALLKAQLAIRPLPLGCYWPAGTEHPLTERIAMLKRSNPSLIRRLAGAACIGVLALGAGYAAWAAAPTAVPVITAPFEFLSDVMGDEAPQPLMPTEPGTPPEAESATPVVENLPPQASAQSAQDAGPYPFARYFDGNAPLVLRGSIVRVDYVEPYTMIWVQASSTAAAGANAVPNTQLWLVEAGPPDRMPANIATELAVGQPVAIRGYNAKDKSCTPNCRMNARDITFPNGARFSNTGQPACASPDLARGETQIPACIADAMPTVSVAPRYIGKVSTGPGGARRYTFPQVLSDIRNPNGARGLIAIRMVVDIANDATADVLNDNMPRLTAMIQAYLRELGPEDFTGEEASNRFRQELMRRVALIVGQNRIKAVYLDELTVQFS